jgi:hypothetical protein
VIHTIEENPEGFVKNIRFFSPAYRCGVDSPKFQPISGI